MTTPASPSGESGASQEDRITGGSIGMRAAMRVIEGALDHRLERGFAPLTVAVLDAGGHLVALQREDRSGIMRVEIAFGKAWGALGLRVPSRDIQRRGESHPWLVQGLIGVSSGRMVPAPGGVLIRSGRDVVGAVGISGDTSEPDEECAVAGIRAAGFEPDATSTEPW